MSTILNSVTVRGFDAGNPGDPVATVVLQGMEFQAGETALWDFVDAVAALVGQQQNVDTVVTTKYETLVTVVQ
jgi:hypothetical protein